VINVETPASCLLPQAEVRLSMSGKLQMSRFLIDVTELDLRNRCAAA
jgi:hypothetical protein